MARQISDSKAALLRFKEIQNLIDGYIGARSNRLDKKIDPNKVRKQQSTLLGVMEMFIAYMGQTPSEICDITRKLWIKNECNEIMRKVEGFPKWLIVTKKYVPSTANTYYGMARALFSHNNIPLSFKNFATDSEHDNESQELGIGVKDLYEIACRMYNICNDIQVKAFMQVGINGGLRISDNLRIPINELKIRLQKTEEFLCLKINTQKAGVDAHLVLHEVTQYILNEYLLTIQTREGYTTYLFGDDLKKAEYNITKKLRNLYEKVIEKWYPNLVNADLSRRLVTSHVFRKLFEHFMKGARVDRNVYRDMDGHTPDKIGKIYEGEDWNLYMDAMKAAMVMVSFEKIHIPKDNKEQWMLDLVKYINSQMENKGKMDTLIHRVTVIESDEKRLEDFNISEQLEIQIAMLVQNLQKSIIEKLSKQ